VNFSGDWWIFQVYILLQEVYRVKIKDQTPKIRIKTLCLILSSFVII